MGGASHVAIFGVGRDEGAEADDPAVGEEFGNFGDAPDVLHALIGRQAKVLDETLTNVVAVEALGGNVAQDEDDLLFLLSTLT